MKNACVIYKVISQKAKREEGKWCIYSLFANGPAAKHYMSMVWKSASPETAKRLIIFKKMNLTACQNIMIQTKAEPEGLTRIGLFAPHRKVHGGWPWRLTVEADGSRVRKAPSVRGAPAELGAAAQALPLYWVITLARQGWQEKRG